MFKMKYDNKNYNVQLSCSSCGSPPISFDTGDKGNPFIDEVHKKLFEINKKMDILLKGQEDIEKKLHGINVNIEELYYAIK